MKKDFLSKYGEGFHLFDVPLDETAKRYLVGLLADRIPATLDEEEIERRYSLRVHFLEKRDSIIVYCDKRTYAVIVLYGQEFRVSGEVLDECLGCYKDSGLELNGTEAQTFGEGDYRREAVFCEDCLTKLTEQIDNQEFKASVLSKQI